MIVSVLVIFKEMELGENKRVRSVIQLNIDISIIPEQLELGNGYIYLKIISIKMIVTIRIFVKH